MLLDHIIIYVWNITVLNYSSLKYWPAVKVTDPDFADDLALITDSVAEAQDFLRSLELAANSVGLHLNEGKTKYMGINKRDDNPTLVAGRALSKFYPAGQTLQSLINWDVCRDPACHYVILKQDPWTISESLH